MQNLVRPAPVSTSHGGTAVSSNMGSGLLRFAMLLEVEVSAFEGPLRYALNLVHLDSLIFLRDALLITGIVWYVIERLAKRSLPAAVPLFAMLMGAHSAISYLNLHAAIPIVYGFKLALPLLAGFLAPEAFFLPRGRVFQMIAITWVITLVGAAVDHVVPTDMPWVGVTIDMGGIDVQLARDWQSGALKRVGGLSRSSTCLAVLMPLLSMILLGKVKHRLVRGAICICTLVVLYWTTQKGAILGFGLVTLALATSGPRRTFPLRTGVTAMACVVVLAPTLLIYVKLPESRGVFSLESFADRINQMWPDGWHWIGKFPPLVGIGLGGIGGAQRFFSPNDFNAADNLFLFLYGNCGIASVIYVGGATLVGVCAKLRDRRDASVLASLLFLLSYGVVVSLIEDQIASLWIGATLAWLAATRADEPSPKTAALPPTTPVYPH